MTLSIASKNKLIGLLIALVFLTPMVAAFVGYFYSDRLHFNTINKGTLIDPPVDISQLSWLNTKHQSMHFNAWQPQWTVVYLAQQQCDTPCQQMIHTLQQIHIALGKKQPNVALLVILPENSASTLITQLQKQYPQFAFGYLNDHDWTALTRTLPANAPLAVQGGVFILDPMSRLMMSYATVNNPKDILSDLRKVVK